MNGNSPVPSQNTPQRFEDLPIYLQATAGSGVQPFEFAEQRRVGGHGITYTSVKVYNGPVNSGNTHNNHGVGTFKLMFLMAGVIVVLIVVVRIALGGAA